MRSPVRVAVLGVLFALVVSASLAERPLEPVECQYVHVVDPCLDRLIIFKVGEDEPISGISLSSDLLEAYDPGGIDFATVPEYGSNFVFVTQGPFLHVLHQARPEDVVPLLLDLEQDLGLDAAWLFRVHAASPVQIGSETRYPLYAIGTRYGEPWVFVLDQEVLLAEEFDPASALLASGPVCVDGVECAGIGIDIAAGAFPAIGGVQDAYASVLNSLEGLAYQRAYKVTLREDGSLDVSLDPWNDEGGPVSASLAMSLGVDYDSFGLQAYGVFQTSRVVGDLSDGGDASCPLPGDPTDVVTWGPGVGLHNANFHFVTTNDSHGEDLLLVFPVEECSDDTPAAFEFPVGAAPQALALSSDTDNRPWVYTVSRDFGVTAYHLRLSSDGDAGDTIEVEQKLEIPVAGGCPYEVTVRDPQYETCETFPPTTPKPPKVDCDEDPDDPRCIEKDTGERPVDLGQN